MTKGMETDEIIVRCGAISMGQIHNEFSTQVQNYRSAIPVRQMNLLRYKQSYNSTCVPVLLGDSVLIRTRYIRKTKQHQ